MAFKASTIPLVEPIHGFPRFLTAGTAFKRILKLNVEIILMVFDSIIDVVYKGYHDIY